MLNIPPHMLAEMSHSTFSNIEHQTIQFVQYTLRPIVKRLEVELETKLFSRSDADVKFILDGLLRGDTAARTAYYHQAVLDGWLTRNEAREMEGFEKKEGLDTFLYPQNEGMVGEENNDNI
jgi:HK97 family phage portal protein